MGLLLDGVINPDHKCIDFDLVSSIDATCTSDSTEIYVCKECGKEKIEHSVLGGHILSDAIIENEIPATCTEKGSYDEVIYCARCNEELSRITKTQEALGHNFVNTNKYTFAELKQIASENKAAEHGITLGTQINLCNVCSRCNKPEGDLKAEVVEIGNNYIEFCTTSNIFTVYEPEKTIKLNNGTEFTGCGPAAMYDEPLVNYGNKDNTATISYNGSYLQTNVHAWFDAQSEEFKNAVMDSSYECQTATLTHSNGYYAQSGINGTTIITEKVYIPTKNKIKNIFSHSSTWNNLGCTWTSTPYPYGYSNETIPYFSMGMFQSAQNGTTSEYMGNSARNGMGAIVLFKIGN